MAFALNHKVALGLVLFVMLASLACSALQQSKDETPSSSPKSGVFSAEDLAKEYGSIDTPKLNATEKEKKEFRYKIERVIAKMDELQRQKELEIRAPTKQSEGVDCVITIPKYETLPGKCDRFVDGIKVCKAKGYMNINNDCP